MSTDHQTISIRWDEQDPQNKGWAYFVEGGESGLIDGLAAEAIDGILNNTEAAPGGHRALIGAIGARPGDQVWLDLEGTTHFIDLALLLGLDAAYDRMLCEELRPVIDGLLIESIILELDGMGGAVHFGADPAEIYEELRPVIDGLLADHPTMPTEVAFILGEAAGCMRHQDWDGAVHELERIMNMLEEE